MSASPVDYALRYVALGWAVLPLYGLSAGRCACGAFPCGKDNRSAGKHPHRDLVPHGVHDASKDEARVRDWFARVPGANVGIATGAASGFDAVDVDPRNGGDDTLADAERKHGKLPDTALQLTGGGGYHYLLAHDPDARLRSPGRGIDIKSTGGYIVAEPSSHASGGTYAWEGSADPTEGHPIAPAPEWLRTQAPSRSAPAAAGGVGFLPPQRIADLRAALAHLDAEPYAQWIAVGQALHSTEAPEAFEIWDTWSQSAANYDGSTAAKWRTFNASGPLHVESIFVWARDAGWDGRAPRVAETSPALSTLWADGTADRFTFDELTHDPEPTRYTVFPYLPAGIAAVLVGAGGTSKTGVMTLIGVHICTGEPLFGGRVERGKVLFVTAEDRRDVLRKHVWAHARHLPPILRQRVADNFIPADVVGLGFKLTRSINGQTVVAPDVDGLVKFAETIPDLRLVVFDTLSRLNGGEETNEDLARVVEAMEAVSRATGASTLIAHHTGKAQARDAIADQYSSRGASSLSDNARSVMLVQVVGTKDKDAPTNAGDLLETKALLRLTHVKANDIAGPPKYLRRLPTAHRAQLVPFEAEFADGDNVAAVWRRVAAWLGKQQEVPHPTLRTLEGLGDEYGSRRQLRDAVHWALDRGLLVERPHPEPKGARKTFLALPSDERSGAIAEAA